MIVSIGRGTANVSKRIVETQRIPFSYGIGTLSRKFHTLLPDRSIIRATGKDSEKLLQNLTTNDVKKINEGEGQLTAFLNPQGRTISFGFLYRASNENEFYIDLDKNVVQETLSLIKKFKLRSKIVLDDVSQEIGVLATLSANGKESLISIKDSRSPNMGFRSIVNKEGQSSEEKQFQEYTIHRIKQGIAETSKEIVLGGMPLEENLDLMNGVDFRKGCYIGQELTARTHHTGVIRKRIVPVSLSENLDDLINSQDIQSQTDIQLEGITSGMDVRSEPISKANTNSEGNPTSPSRGRSAGKLLSCINNVGLAMLRLEQVNRWNKDFTMKVLIGDKQIFVKPFIPNWWPEEAKQPS